eukprot:scaffold21057_cov63-Cyclotella_meneghiniana.AAC.4
MARLFYSDTNNFISQQPPSDIVRRWTMADGNVHANPVNLHVKTQMLTFLVRKVGNSDQNCHPSLTEKPTSADH